MYKTDVKANALGVSFLLKKLTVAQASPALSTQDNKMATQRATAAVPAFKCPPGTKMHIPDPGTIQADEGWLLRGGNSSSLSDKNPENKRRDLIVLATLIEHPDAGLILFETGCAEDIDVVKHMRREHCMPS